MGNKPPKQQGGATPRDAVATVLKENNRAIFNGNGYSDEWPVEAAERGLLNLRNTPEAHPYHPHSNPTHCMPLKPNASNPDP